MTTGLLPSSAASPTRGQPAGGRRLLEPGLWLAGASVWFTALYVVDPNEPGHFPTCPFLWLTGFYCPGCGSMRCTHDLLHGDLAGAFARNPVLPIVYVALAIGFTRWTIRLWRGLPRTHLAPPWRIQAIAWAYVAFFVLRNVPGWTWLSPA